MHIEVEREYYVSFDTATLEGAVHRGGRFTLTREECVQLRDSLNAILGEPQRPAPVAAQSQAADDDVDDERPWTPAEDATMNEMLNIGRPVRDVAQMLGRSGREVALRVKQLG